MLQLPWHVYLMGIFYLVAGINHFRIPDHYIKIMPSYIPEKDHVNEFIGGAFVFLAVLLMIPMFTRLAAISLIPLLIVVFPANINMLLNKKAHMDFPKWLLLIRLPLQILLIFWAYQYINYYYFKGTIIIN
jgi:uncharacterized membrane protein